MDSISLRQVVLWLAAPITAGAIIRWLIIPAVQKQLLDYLDKRYKNKDEADREHGQMMATHDQITEGFQRQMENLRRELQTIVGNDHLEQLEWQKRLTDLETKTSLWWRAMEKLAVKALRDE